MLAKSISNPFSYQSATIVEMRIGRLQIFFDMNKEESIIRILRDQTKIIDFKFGTGCWEDFFQ